MGASGALEEVASLVWLGRAKTIEEAVESYRAVHNRRAGEGLEIVRAELMHRSTESITVDGRRVPFDVIALGRDWIGRTRLSSVWVTVRAHDFPLEGLELWTVKDVTPYSKEIPFKPLWRRVKERPWARRIV
jgi:hypothetical protein